MGPAKSPSVRGDWTNRMQSDPLPVHSQGLCGLQGQAGNVAFPLEACGESLWSQDLWRLALRLTSFIVLFNFLTRKVGGDKDCGCFGL